jgi:ribosomal protein S8
MSQDIVSDTLNQLMNAIKAGKDSLAVHRYSRMLLSILAIAKLKGYLKDYKIENKSLKIEIGKLNGCSSIKPRYVATVEEIDKFISNYLPAKDLGIIVVSTSQGLMTHQTAQQKNLGGSLVAYFY